MPTPPRILAFAGSVRAESLNRTLLRFAVNIARSAGADVTVLEFKDYPLPLMDEDLESREGVPEAAMKLKQVFKEHHALLIAAPEYNSSITPLLKNAIDWISRPVPGEPPLGAFQGKVATLISASPGDLGGLRGLVHLRAILGNIGVIVLPDQFALTRAHEAFGAEGNLKDAKQTARLEGVVKKLVVAAGRFAS